MANDANEINPEWFKSQASKVTEEDLKKVGDKADEIKAKTKGPLGRYIEDVKLLISLVKDYASGDYREIPWFSIAAVTFALLYVLSPIDIIPDIIPVVGLLDDALVVGICLSLVEEDLHNYKSWKTQQA